MYRQATYQELSPRALLFHLAGKSEDKKHVSIFMAHFDVVDVEQTNWVVPAFEGVRKNGVLYGRGAIDTKGTLNGILRAAEELLEKGFLPEHDMYFAFAGDEEIAGGSAQLAVDYFRKINIEPLIVLDEGGAVVDGLFPGVKRPAAAIGTAEKGVCALEFHIDGEGGHASAPKKHSPVGKLAQLAVAIEKHPFKMHLSQPAQQTFNVLAREAPFSYRLIFANLWLFKPVIDQLTRKTGGQFNALIRTTTALTMMEGSPVTNVIPSHAMIGANVRLNPPDTIEKVLRKYEKMAKRYGARMNPVTRYQWNPSAISTIQTPEYDKMADAIRATWGNETLVSPFLMTGCADAHFYSTFSDKVYRFSAIHLTEEQLKMIHGDNEQLTERQIGETVEFYYRLMKSL